MAKDLHHFISLTVCIFIIYHASVTFWMLNWCYALIMNFPIPWEPNNFLFYQSLLSVLLINAFLPGAWITLEDRWERCFFLTYYPCLDANSLSAETLKTEELHLLDKDFFKAKKLFWCCSWDGNKHLPTISICYYKTTAPHPEQLKYEFRLCLI